jgi:cephalosporin-C deacetylase-like acetyl esterase
MSAATLALAKPTLVAEPGQASGIYQPDQDIVWHVKLSGVPPTAYSNLVYVLKAGGGTVVGQGTATLRAGAADIHGRLDQPGTVLAEITATNAGQPTLTALAGAAVAPDKIPVSSPCPEDFDAFWQAKLAELARVPAAPVLKPEPAGKKNVDYWKITLNNIRGTHIYGQLARPATGKKFPAMLIVQYAGVYPLAKNWAVDRAAEGWLVLNIIAHDLPIDRPAAFYDDLRLHALKDYPAIGNDDREQSYFLRMFLGCYRAVDYLAHRPDWNGQTLVVTGTSQGGLQSFVAAGLNHQVTAVMALVPAGCDNTGALAGRKPGWPYWMAHPEGKDAQRMLQTSRYFDGVNFAARIQCPVLAGLGLIDTTAAPSGVFAALNQIHAPKEVVVMPLADHHGNGNTHAPYLKRLNVWREALLKGEPVPSPAPGKS